MAVIYEVCIDQAEVDRRMVALLVGLLRGRAIHESPLQDAPLRVEPVGNVLLDSVPEKVPAEAL